INVVSLLFDIAGTRVVDAGNVLYRDDYNGQMREYDISLTYEEDEAWVNLVVMPMEYTVEEFYEKSEKLFCDFETELVGDNEDLLHIRGDIHIPENPEKVFDITWLSDSPKILASTGKVNTDEITDKAFVTLTATIEYGELSASHEYRLGIEGTKEATVIELVEGELYNLEQENRNQREILIPKDLSGVKVSLEQEKNNTSVYIFLLGTLFCIILAFRKAAGLKQDIRNRDRRLMDLYPWFVNSLWLTLGAGVTVKSGIKQLIAGGENGNPLVLELEYAINQIDSGLDEAKAYEDLGRRIGLNVYVRLMHQLSRNLKIGTKDLLRLMEDELAAALEIRKENAKRKGEEASTKLLFPMVVLLLIVMLMIVTPVLVSL
ncbi:MAG: type II secretion system F family protein, partial [Ruminococcus sp.]|nr:type II secretion system F family protein [Ruminococcus sp.]